jgi:PPE-repeat protein
MGAYARSENLVGDRPGNRTAAAGNKEDIVMGFGALPPEVNSARMYAGTGSGSMVAAAAAWDGVAAELNSAATSYQAVVSELTGGPWLGPSSLSMAGAAAGFVAWIKTTAAQAQLAASQTRSAVAAYEAAFSPRCLRR